MLQVVAKISFCERTKDLDYGSAPSWQYLYKGYPSQTSTYSYTLYTDINGNNIDFSID